MSQQNNHHLERKKESKEQIVVNIKTIKNKPMIHRVKQKPHRTETRIIQITRPTKQIQNRH
jgi:hypothetical protein